MWTIKLIGDDVNKLRAYAIYGREYFPRSFHYKKEAQELLERLTDLGIDAELA